MKDKWEVAGKSFKQRDMHVQRSWGQVAGAVNKENGEVSSAVVVFDSGLLTPTEAYFPCDRLPLG